MLINLVHTSASEDHANLYFIIEDINMEAQTLTGIHQLTNSQRLLSAVVPVLFIAMSYVSPGRLAAAVEGGAHFGLDLILLLLVFNFAAILCQYLSARITVVTGIDLAKVCSIEYDRLICIYIGSQAKISMIALDLMMVLGTAHGLNALFDIDLFTGVLITAVNCLALPFLAILFEVGRVRLLSICLSMVVLLFYIFNVLISHPRNPPSLGGTTSRLNGESVFAMMSLLGANIMPHNFYLHSSIVQQYRLSKNVSKGVLCHDHLFSILCFFSGIFLVHYELISSAAIELSSLSTFQDTFDQVFRSSFAHMALIALMFFFNQVMAASWNFGGQVVVHDLLELDIPGWLHHATDRIVALIPALFCAWNSGAEGVYQMLVLTQVVVALMLPASVIPLFRVASSSSIMGIYKISRFEEFLTLVTFIGMLGLSIVFFMELSFGNTEWANSLWDTESSVPVAYVILVISASVSFCLMLWLVATPLKSTSRIDDIQFFDWNLYMKTSVLESFAQRGQNDISLPANQIETIEKQEPGIELEKYSGSFLDLSSPSAILNLPDMLDVSYDVNQATVHRKKSEASATEGTTYFGLTTREDSYNGESKDFLTLRDESVEISEKTSRLDGDSQSLKNDVESCKPVETTKMSSNISKSLTSNGPPLFTSLSGICGEPGSDTGSLSKLTGLGRAGRRQLTVILDELWGQIFDFHGQLTPEASTKKLDVLLSFVCKADSKRSSASVKMDNGTKDLTEYFPSSVGGESDSIMTSCLHKSSYQQMGESMFESSDGALSSPSMWATQKPLDAYPKRNGLDYAERRYSSMRIPPSSDSYDRQPATVHGYELASYFGRVSKEGDPGLFKDQTEPQAPDSTSLTMLRYGDSVSRLLLKKAPNSGFSSQTPPGFDRVSIPRDTSLRSDRSLYSLSSPKPVDCINRFGDAKKYYSFPDISCQQIPHHDSTMFSQSRERDNSLSYGNIGSPTCERISSGSLSRGAASSLHYSFGGKTMSLWCRQPSEQFGLADKNHVEGELVKMSSRQETESIIDSEAKLLQSFRYCIVKLLKLDGPDWLFRQNDGVDEDLIGRVATREKFLYDVESRQTNQPNILNQSHCYSDHKAASMLRSEEADYTKFLIASVPHCGERCVYKVDLIVSFGVWCIHRILELSLIESRPELWGKYTFVLNRLQGVIDLAFFKPRSPMTPCFCLQLPVGWQQKCNPPVSKGNFPPHLKPGHGKCTTAAMLLDIIKDVELAISCRKGRTGTAAGDIAFPKGKQNLASVLKRYKRRLSSKSL